MQDYDENNEIVIAGMDDPEEAARNRAIMEDLEASIAAAAAAAVRGRGKGRGGARGRGRGARGRGRPPLSGGAGFVGGRAFGALPSFDQYGLGGGGAGGGGASRRNRNVSFAEDYDIEAGDSDLTAGRHGSRITKRQVAKHLQRLVEHQGQWDAPRGGATATAAAALTIPPSLPSEAWEALANAAPETADLACAAADLASSVRYFESNGPAEQAVVEAGVLARLGAVLAASSGLVDCQDALTKVERDRLGLDEAAGTPLPDPTEPLDNLLLNSVGAVGVGGAIEGVPTAETAILEDGDVAMEDGV